MNFLKIKLKQKCLLQFDFGDPYGRLTFPSTHAISFPGRFIAVLNEEKFKDYLLNELIAASSVLGIKNFFRTEQQLIEEFGTSVPEAIFNDFGRNESFEVKRFADFSKPRTRDLGCTPVGNFDRSRGKPRSMWSLMIWGAVSKVTPEMAFKYNIKRHHIVIFFPDTMTEKKRNKNESIVKKEVELAILSGKSSVDKVCLHFATLPLEIFESEQRYEI